MADLDFEIEHKYGWEASRVRVGPKVLTIFFGGLAYMGSW